MAENDKERTVNAGNDISCHCDTIPMTLYSFIGRRSNLVEKRLSCRS